MNCVSILNSEVLPERIGVCLGVGMVDMVDICEQYATMATAGPKRVSPYFIPRNLINMSAAHVSMRFGLRGPNQAQSTACTTGLHSVGETLGTNNACDMTVLLRTHRLQALYSTGVLLTCDCLSQLHFKCTLLYIHQL